MLVLLERKAFRVNKVFKAKPEQLAQSDRLDHRVFRVKPDQQERKAYRVKSDLPDRKVYRVFKDFRESKEILVHKA